MAEISVIVPVYKVEPYLHRCVDSILAQTFTDFELILVDDGSPDDCGVICDEYAEIDNRIHVIHQENRGRAASRNAGLDWVFANSDSEWLCFVDSDDWIHPKFIELLYRAAIEKNVSISCCRYKKMVEPESIGMESVVPIVSVVPSEQVYTHGGKGVYTYLWDKLYKKGQWRNIRFPMGRDWEDYAVLHKVLLSVPHVAFIDIEGYYYFVNPEGIVYQQWSPKKMDHLWAIRCVLQDKCISKNSDIRKLVLRDYIFVLYSQLGQIKSSSILNKREKVFYTFLTRRTLREVLLFHRKDCDISFGTHGYLFEAALPIMTWIYWILVSASKKGKKIMNGKSLGNH